VSDQDVINAGLAHAARSHKPIDDLTARVIAAQWHGGQTTPLCALATTGATVADRRDLADPDSALDRILAEIEENRRHAVTRDRRELDALTVYVREAGPRGPQPGWSDLHW
jgi:hypothetical protein